MRTKLHKCKKPPSMSPVRNIWPVYLVKKSNNREYRGLNTALDNEHIIGKYAYSKKMEEALKLLDNYRVVISGTCQMHTQESASVALLTKSEMRKVKDRHQ